jgi:hypothetical protein
VKRRRCSPFWRVDLWLAVTKSPYPVSVAAEDFSHGVFACRVDLRSAQREKKPKEKKRKRFTSRGRDGNAGAGLGTETGKLALRRKR